MRWPFLWNVNRAGRKSAMILPNWWRPRSFLGHCIGFIYIPVEINHFYFVTSAPRRLPSGYIFCLLNSFKVSKRSVRFRSTTRLFRRQFIGLSVLSHNFTTWNSVAFLTCIFLLGQCYRRFGFCEGWSNGRHCCCLGISQCSSCFTQGHRKIRFGNYFLMNYVLYRG